MTWKLNSFPSFEQYPFSVNFWRNFRNNVPPTMLSISCNITNATHFNTPPKPPMLAHHSHYHAGTPTSPTVACHPRYHGTHVSTPPTQAHPHATHASTPQALARIACHFSNSNYSSQFKVLRWTWWTKKQYI